MAVKGSQGRSGPGSSSGKGKTRAGTGQGGRRPSTQPGKPAQPSKAVYRRRRLALLLVAAVVLASLAWGGFALAGALTADKDASASGPSQPAPSASPSGSATPKADSSKSGEPAPSDEPAETDAMCPAAAVTVAASTDVPAYAAGANPLLTLSVTNTGSEPCEINVGTNQMEFIVTSGSDRIFSSADCQDGGEDLVKEFAPGATEKANFTWDRMRSAPGCGAVASNPNPGWYVFTARLGETTSEKAVFQLD
ncbi:hypothetical protein [Arthrobacter sp.]|uniref:hypothetical protein n=1 Tax=Arthrobacter sp. TaxID=1667 RepID=UPI00289F07F2|nr:hypothetical protein [Arthrobacter sp.]